MKKTLLKKLDLHLFEEGVGTPPPTNQSTATDDNSQTEKTFTQDEMNAVIGKTKAELKAKHEKELEEIKLQLKELSIKKTETDFNKLTEEQKAEALIKEKEAEFEKKKLELEKEMESLKKKERLSEVSTRYATDGLPQFDGVEKVLKLIADVDSTDERADIYTTFKGLIDSAKANAIKEITGSAKAPEGSTTSTQAVSNPFISPVNYTEITKLVKNDRDLAKKMCLEAGKKDSFSELFK